MSMTKEERLKYIKASSERILKPYRDARRAAERETAKLEREARKGIQRAMNKFLSASDDECDYEGGF